VKKRKSSAKKDLSKPRNQDVSKGAYYEDQSRYTSSRKNTGNYERIPRNVPSFLNYHSSKNC
jgi:hypothetical protein